MWAIQNQTIARVDRIGEIVRVNQQRIGTINERLSAQSARQEAAREVRRVIISAIDDRVSNCEKRVEALQEVLQKRSVIHRKDVDRAMH